MKYSKISSWRVKNFRNIGDITLDFTKSPIISLIGANEAGKTSIVKSFGVLGANTEPTEQKEYIRDNTNGFGIACVLEDGTQINRVKTELKNSIDIFKNGVSVYSADKIDRGYGVPVELEKEMGLSVEPETGELLQIRTYEDNLLFVQTKGSENYKVMYNALKVDNISKAIKAGIQESNMISSSIKDLESGLFTLQETLKNIKVLDITTLIKVRDKIKSILDSRSKIEKLIYLNDKLNDLSRKLCLENDLTKLSEIEVESIRLLESLVKYIKELDSLNKHKEKLENIESLYEINLYTLSNFNRVIELLNKISSLDLCKYESLEDINEISYDNLDKFNILLSSLENYNKLEYELNKYQSLYDLAVIDSTYIDNLIKLNYLMELCTKIEYIDNKIKDVEKQSNEYYTFIKESGICVTDCPNCGSSVVIEQSI